MNNWNNISNQSSAYKLNLQKQEQLKKLASDKYILNFRMS